MKGFLDLILALIERKEQWWWRWWWWWGGARCWPLRWATMVQQRVKVPKILWKHENLNQYWSVEGEGCLHFSLAFVWFLPFPFHDFLINHNKKTAVIRESDSKWKIQHFSLHLVFLISRFLLMILRRFEWPSYLIRFVLLLPDALNTRQRTVVQQVSVDSSHATTWSASHITLFFTSHSHSPCPLL